MLWLEARNDLWSHLSGYNAGLLIPMMIYADGKAQDCFAAEGGWRDMNAIWEWGTTGYLDPAQFGDYPNASDALISVPSQKYIGRVDKAHTYQIVGACNHSNCIGTQAGYDKMKVAMAAAGAQ